METGQLQSECIWATTLWFQLWMDGWMSTCGGRGRRKCMSDQPCWHHTINCGSVYFLELKDVTVFIIIMKIIIMMIIMMVIKRKNLLRMLHFYHARWHSLIVVPQAPGAGWGNPGSGFCLPMSGLPVSGDKGPSSSKKLMPLMTLVCTFSPKYVQENCVLLFSCLELPHCYTLMLQYRN